MYFGGINGFNVFQPEQFVDNKYIPPVYVTDIRLPYQTDEQEVKKLLQLDKPLYMADKVTLSYENNSFSIRFVALSFEDPGKNRYSYILRGVDKEWILNTDNNMASYTNLPPGEYLFEVRGSNNDRQWNENTTTLKVVITLPGGVVPLLTSFMCSCCWDGSAGWLGDGTSVLNANINGGWKNTRLPRNRKFISRRLAFSSIWYMRYVLRLV